MQHYYNTSQDIKPFATFHKTKKKESQCFYDGGSSFSYPSSYWQNDVHGKLLLDGGMNSYNSQNVLARGYDNRGKYQHFGISKYDFQSCSRLRIVGPAMYITSQKNEQN